MIGAGFNPGGGADSTVYAIAVQMDGKVLVGGVFNQIDGVVRKHIARLNPDGSLDMEFDPGAAANSDEVYSLALQTAGKLLAGGYFTSIGGAYRESIARLSNDTAALQALTVEGGTVHWRRSRPSPELALPPELSFSVSGNPGTFVSLGHMQRSADGWRLYGFAAPLNVSFSLRAQGRTSGGSYNGSSGLIESTRRFYLSEACSGADVIFCNGFD